ncbi:MAG: CZB domain-containing protein [Thiotrichaceae bacterium]|nr:CZB domain-containing protein [Thiotrichaceae bacterium]
MKPTDEAILAHSNWKNHLKEAIDKGESQFTAKEAGDYSHCKFGQWLESPEGKNLPNHSDLASLHQHFHQKASKILVVALKGQKDEALPMMQSGSEFSLLSSKLITEIIRLENLWTV